MDLQPTAASMRLDRPPDGVRAHRLRGWDNPLPIALRLDPAAVDGLRDDIARNLALLAQQCAELDRVLPPELLAHPGYMASRRSRGFVPVLEEGGAVPLSRKPAAPTLRTRHPAIVPDDRPLDQLLTRVTAVVAVGRLTTPMLAGLAAGRGAPCVAAGEGQPVAAASGATRPQPGSFSAWWAHADEAERAEIGAFLLGREAGRLDAALLRRRLHGHQRVVVEPGAPALTWLLAEWDGTIRGHDGFVVFSEPGPVFRAPLGPWLDGAAWPRISVVTVSFNQVAYLGQCLDSIAAQRYPNLEHIVVDGGSTDGSAALLRARADRFAHLSIGRDGGQSDALNRGFARATGEILTWVASDDMLAPLALRRAAAAFADSGADMVAGTCSRVEGADARLLFRHHAALPAGRRVALDPAAVLDWQRAWEPGDFFFQPEVFFTRDLWEHAGGYLQTHLHWAMDWELWLRCALAGATVLRIPDVLGISRAHAAQKTTAATPYLWQVAGILAEYDTLLAWLQAAR